MFVELPIRVYKASKDVDDAFMLQELGIKSTFVEGEDIIVKNGCINRSKISLFYPSDNEGTTIIEMGSGIENSISIALSYEEVYKILQ